MKYTVGFAIALLVLPTIIAQQWRPTLNNIYPPPSTVSRVPYPLVSPWKETEVDIEQHEIVHPAALQILPPGVEPRTHQSGIQAKLTEDRIVGDEVYDIDYRAPATYQNGAIVYDARTDYVNAKTYLPDTEDHAQNAADNGYTWIEQPHEMGNALAGVQIPHNGGRR